MGVWSNPAKLGYFEDFSWGWTHDGWFEKVIPNIYFDSSYLTYGQNGIGFMVPFINNFKKFGTSLDFGKQVATNTSGAIVDTFRSYETCSQFAVGINSFQFFNHFINPLENALGISKNLEISFGYCIDFISSTLPDSPMIDSLYLEPVKKSSHNVGGLIKITPPLKSFNDFYIELTAGLNLINISRAKMDYNNTEKGPIPYGTKSAVAGKFSFINLSNYSSLQKLFPSYLEYLLSIYATYDNAKYGNNPSIWSKGIEFSLFDMFFIRYGEYYDIQGHMVGDSKGYGINFKYDLIKFQYNYSKSPGGELQYTQEKYDIEINIDILKMIDRMKNTVKN